MCVWSVSHVATACLVERMCTPCAVIVQKILSTHLKNLKRDHVIIEVSTWPLTMQLWKCPHSVIGLKHSARGQVHCASISVGWTEWDGLSSNVWCELCVHRVKQRHEVRCDCFSFSSVEMVPAVWHRCYRVGNHKQNYRSVGGEAERASLANTGNARCKIVT